MQSAGLKAKTMQRIHRITCSVLFLSLMGLGGCDSLGEAAAQGTEASLRTLIDLLLTDFTNQVADALLPPDQDEDEDDNGDADPPDLGDDDPPDDGEPVTFFADIQPIPGPRRPG